MAIFPAGTKTAHVSPALVAYAAADAEVFPVDAQMTACAPCARALVIAMVIPRSLNDPVGFIPSNFTYTFAPARSERCSAKIRGVPPSPRLTTGVSASMSRYSRYSLITPCHWCAMSASPYWPSMRRTDWISRTTSSSLRCFTVWANALSVAECVAMTSLARESPSPWSSY